MVKNKDDAPVVVTGNEARAGVTGHHVRYVLAFGLAGSIVAFIVIELYFYYSKLTHTISQTSARIDPAMLVSYAIPIALAAVAVVLLLGLGNMIMPRGSPNTSQTLMRWRVVLQFVALCLVMGALYLAGKS
jgi:protein-S-isoprenylcysteine O-methyltransferase Ste14